MDKTEKPQMKPEEWHPYHVQTDAVPMVDAAIGRPMLLETFEFAVKPTPPGTPFPTNQQLFNSHWEQIKLIIWGKGLVANTDVPPRIVVGKKRYRIFILCEPKFNKFGIKSVPGTPKTLQDIFRENPLTNN